MGKLIDGSTTIKIKSAKFGIWEDGIEIPIYNTFIIAGYLVVNLLFVLTHNNFYWG